MHVIVLSSIQDYHTRGFSCNSHSLYNEFFSLRVQQHGESSISLSQGRIKSKIRLKIKFFLKKIDKKSQRQDMEKNDVKPH